MMACENQGQCSDDDSIIDMHVVPHLLSPVLSYSFEQYILILTPSLGKHESSKHMFPSGGLWCWEYSVLLQRSK